MVSGSHRVKVISGMMNERKSLKEFRHELNLSQDKHVVVEGHSDRRFYSAWLDAHDFLDGVSVHAVDTLQVEDDLVRELELPGGARGRVIALARETQDRHDRVLCVADRDTGHDVDEFRYRTLIWTDYPALESYVMHPKLFRMAHQLCLQGTVNDSEKLYRDLAIALGRIWQTRLLNPHLEAPNYKKGIKGGVGLAEFDVCKAVRPGTKIERGGGEVELPSDVRAYSYGHDIAHLLFAAYAPQLKNKLHFGSEKALEVALLGTMLNSNLLASEKLFVQLETWARAGAD